MADGDGTCPNVGYVGVCLNKCYILLRLCGWAPGGGLDTLLFLYLKTRQLFLLVSNFSSC